MNTDNKQILITKALTALMLIMTLLSCGGGTSENQSEKQSNNVFYLSDSNNTTDLNLLAYNTISGKTETLALPQTGVTTSTINRLTKSPSNKYLAYIQNKTPAVPPLEQASELYLHDIATRTSIRIAGNLNIHGIIFDYQWSPDSGYIAFSIFTYTSGTTLYSYHIPTATTTQLSVLYKYSPINTNHFGQLQKITWSPNSQYIAYYANQADDPLKHLYIVTPDNSNHFELSANFPENTLPLPVFYWSPSSNKILAITSEVNSNPPNNTLLISDLVSRQHTKLINNIADNFSFSISSDNNPWSVDSKYILLRRNFFDGAGQYISQSLYTIASDTIAAKEISSRYASIGYSFWSTTGTYISYLANKTSADLQRLYAVKPDGSELIELSSNIPTDKTILHHTPSPDGQYIAFVSGNVSAAIFELFSVEPFVAPAVNISTTSIYGIKGGVANYFWSSDGSRLAFFTNNTSSLITYLAIHTVKPDGTELYTLYSPFVQTQLSYPIWCSGNEYLLFTTDNETKQSSNIYITKYDASELKMISNFDKQYNKLENVMCLK